MIAPPTEVQRPYGFPTTPEEVKEFIQGLPASIQECGHEAVGEAAYEELASGTRMPTSEEIQKVFGCFGY